MDPWSSGDHPAPSLPDGHPAAQVPGDRSAPPGQGGRPLLRASDADRDRVASVLSNAVAEGRLTAAEHSERLDLVYAATTQAELLPLLEDIPPPADRLPVGRAGCPAGREDGPASRIVAVFAGASRKGTWRVPLYTSVVTVFGGARIDLRDAVLPSGTDLVVHLVAVFGGVIITVPPEMRVIGSGIAFFGGRGLPDCGEEPELADGPVLRLDGTCVFGGVVVTRHPPDSAVGR